jgi:RNAse (barnase) inhibitor barstar
MTALSRLLAGPADGGIYRAPAGSPLTTIERAAARAGWRVAHVVSGRETGKAALLEAFKEALGLPDWFGHNLDALADCLGDVAVEPGTLIVWDGADDFTAADPATSRAVFTILRQRSAADSPARLLTLLREP